MEKAELHNAVYSGSYGKGNNDDDDFKEEEMAHLLVHDLHNTSLSCDDVLCFQPVDVTHIYTPDLHESPQKRRTGRRASPVVQVC